MDRVLQHDEEENILIQMIINIWSRYLRSRGQDPILSMFSFQVTTSSNWRHPEESGSQWGTVVLSTGWNAGWLLISNIYGYTLGKLCGGVFFPFGSSVSIHGADSCSIGIVAYPSVAYQLNVPYLWGLCTEATPHKIMQYLLQKIKPYFP